jgi:hypothetical protein
MKPDGTFAEQPWQEKCQVRYPGCQGTPDVRITCIVEGASLMACHNCHRAWQGQVQSVSGFENRCPRCALWHPERAPVRTFVRAEPLHGTVADTIDRAMHAEGLLLDIRRKVLERLAQDSPWLADVQPSLTSVGNPGEWVIPG